MPTAGNFLVAIFAIIIFIQKKTEKRKICGRLTGHNLSHPLDRKQTFFKRGLKVRGLEPQRWLVMFGHETC